MKTIDYDLGNSLWEMMQRVNNLSNQYFKEFGMGYSQYSSLLIIGEKEGLSIKELANIQVIQKSTAGKTIQRLEKKKLVKRIQNKNDKREYNLFLTKNGKQFLPNLNKAYSLFLIQIMRLINKKEKEFYFKITNKINEGLSK